jgi:hypothetical protein
LEILEHIPDKCPLKRRQSLAENTFGREVVNSDTKDRTYLDFGGGEKDTGREDI